MAVVASALETSVLPPSLLTWARVFAVFLWTCEANGAAGTSAVVRERGTIARGASRTEHAGVVGRASVAPAAFAKAGPHLVGLCAGEAAGRLDAEALLGRARHLPCLRVAAWEAGARAGRWRRGVGSATRSDGGVPRRRP